MLQSLVVLSCCLLTVLAGTPKEHLLRDLLDKYSADVDPGNIRLTLDIELICATYDKETGAVTSNVWERMTWKDERLRWIPAEYSGVSRLRIPARLVWTPDITQYHALSAVNERGDENVVLESDGTVLWIPPVTYHTMCSASGDEITCPWKIGSWTYDGITVALETKDGLGVSYYNDKCPLVVSSHTAEVVSHKYACCDEPYPSFDASIVFKQRS
jgi:hypothetical protein